MALIDLTNVDPYGPQVEAQARAQQASANMWTNISQQISKGIQAGQARRAALEERNMAIRDREYALANQATDKLVQAKSNHKYTDQQLQQVGQQFKQEFYDAVKEYEQSDKGDEARQKFEQVKQRSLGSARTLGDSIEKLGTQMDMFMDQARNGGISDSMNPAVRSFFNDLNDPNTPPEQFQIITDPQTGSLKYQGKTTDGHDVDFFLEDIANGENAFSPIPKADMPKIMNNLMQNVSKITKKEEYDWGVAEVTDWGTIGNVLDGRMEDLFSDPTNFKAMAAGLGYGYEELEKAKNGEAFTDEDGREIKDEASLRDAMKQEMLQQMETIIPNYNRNIQRKQQQQAVEQSVADKQARVESQFNVLSSEGNVDYLNTILTNKSLVIGGKKASFHSLDKKGNIVTLKGVAGGKGTKEQFDLSDPYQVAKLAVLTGADPTDAYNQARIQTLSQI